MVPVAIWEETVKLAHACISARHGVPVCDPRILSKKTIVFKLKKWPLSRNPVTSTIFLDFPVSKTIIRWIPAGETTWPIAYYISQHTFKIHIGVTLKCLTTGCIRRLTFCVTHMFLYIFGIYSKYATFIRENYAHKVILDFSWKMKLLSSFLFIQTALL